MKTPTMKKKGRPNIPKRIEGMVMDKSEGKCYCGNRGHEIHHIDGNNINNDLDNLVFLCDIHHDDATIVLSKAKRLIKRFTPAQVKIARDKHYLQIERKKEIALKHYKATLKDISEENLYKASLDANIVTEVIKIRGTIFDSDQWKERATVLDQLRIYSNYSSLRVSVAVIDFMEYLSWLTRADMPAEFSDLIEMIVFEYFPYPHTARERKVVEELANDCANIALNIIYDALIHLGNFAVACSGFQILKFLAMKSKSYNIPRMRQIVLERYKELEGHLNRPERKDLEKSKLLLKTFKDDLDEFGQGYPVMPSYIFEIITEHRKISRQR